MFLDALTQVSDAQAVVAAAVSTNSIDFGAATPVWDFTRGEEMGFGVAIDVAVSGTTFKTEIISATDAALTAGILVHETYDRFAADFPAGSKHFIAIPVGAALQRFVGLRYTVTGGATTVTVTAALIPASMWSKEPQMHAKNFAV
jgi:hypothetical protein